MAMAGPYLVTRYTVRYSPAPDPAWCRPRHETLFPYLQTRQNCPHTPWSGDAITWITRDWAADHFDHLLVFVADGAEPVMAGHNVELAAVFAHSNIAASEMTQVKRRLFKVGNHIAWSHLQSAPLLMIRPSSALQRPQLRAGSVAQWPPPPPGPPTLTTPRLRRAVSSARSRLKINMVTSDYNELINNPVWENFSRLTLTSPTQYPDTLIVFVFQ